ncbi:MAG: sulfotransferase family protein [Rhodobacterales bacterium]|nr:MAG: sulfotransferase family protein [Rhodobacterales bacterium]
MSRLIVINLGLPKSGTTTLAHALRKAGLKALDHRIRRKDTENTDLHGRFVAGQMYHGYFKSGDPLETLSEFDGFGEINLMRRGHSIWPQTDWEVIRALRDHHPGVRFLASSRDPMSQAPSMLRWSDMSTTRLPRSSVPGLPRGYGQTTHERARWIKGHHDFLRQVFRDASDFLEYDVADPEAPARIGAFIGRYLPWWGRLNASSNSKPAKPVKHNKNPHNDPKVA